MAPETLLSMQDKMIGKFPNNYCYSKRMAEELLIANQATQKHKINLAIIRPSIMAASFAEPVPGWTDSTNFLGGFYTMAGSGILTDLPLNPKLLGD